MDDDNAIVAFRPPPPPPPPPPPRAAKTAAVHAIRQLGARSRQSHITQLEGAEPTPESTPDVTQSFNHHLSPQEPWSPVSFLFQQNYDEQSDNHFDWPSTSSIWSAEDKASLMWDDHHSPPLEPTFDQLISPPSSPLDLPQIFQQARQQAHFDRRYTFGGFDIIPFPKRLKISQPDYSVWGQKSAGPAYQ